GRLLLSGEPAQPRDPGRAPAGLLAQAVHLSGRAATGPPAQYAGAGPSRDPELAARRGALQPIPRVRDQAVTLPPIGGSSYARDKDYWSPKNADGGGGGITTLRRGLENSKNLVTANLLDGGIDSDPSQSLARVCELTIDAQIYRECVAYYPFV